MRSASRAELTELLHPSQLHEISARAQALRDERFGSRASLPFLAHRRQPGSAEWCAICGAQPGEASERTIHASSTDLHVLPPAEADASSLLEGLSEQDDAFRTIQIGCAGDWMAASEGDDHELLKSAHDRGLRVLSDGILPRVHPARGAEASHRWQRFWRCVAELGMVGHATLLQNSAGEHIRILDQIETIAALQDECRVFASVRVVIDPGPRFGGVQDGLLSHGVDDLRALAACRLGLADIEHLTFCFERSDLKVAHVALASGADDLEGTLHLDPRTAREDANSNDLSISEMARWMREAGFTPLLRNGAFETQNYPESASEETSR